MLMHDQHQPPLKASANSYVECPSSSSRCNNQACRLGARQPTIEKYLMKNHELAEITFGLEGTATPYQVSGWSPGEDGYTFTHGTEARISLPIACDNPYGIAVELSGNTFRPPGLPAQPVSIAVNGQAAGGPAQFVRGTYSWLIPEQIRNQPDQAVITIFIPRAARPCDYLPVNDNRILGVMAQRLRVFALDEPVSHWHNAAPSSGSRSELVPTIPNDPALATEFVSLGDDCELGLVQRAMGADPLGLLRFSSAHLWYVTGGIESEWAGLGERLDAAVEQNEWVIRERGYDLRWHTFIAPGATTRDAVLKKERPKTAFLRRKLVEDVAEGGRIFVIKSRDNPAQPEQILTIHLALNRFARNWLLWITADGTAGSVEMIAPRLMRGHVSRFMRHQIADDVLLPEWRQILERAWSLTQSQAG